MKNNQTIHIIIGLVAALIFGSTLIGSDLGASVVLGNLSIIIFVVNLFIPILKTIKKDIRLKFIDVVALNITIAPLFALTVSIYLDMINKTPSGIFIKFVLVAVLIGVLYKVIKDISDRENNEQTKNS